MTLNTENNSVYEQPGNLADVGIYSQQKVDDLKNHIMYPLERQSVQNILSRNMMGIKTDDQNTDNSYLLSQTSIDKLTKNFFEKTWSYFTDFGLSIT